MPTPTTHLGLEAPSTSDAFLTSGVDAAYALIDKFPGIFVDTAANVTAEVATWGINQLGMYAYATDTWLLWQWDGSQLNRPFPLGRLAQTTNTAGGNITTPVTLVAASFTMPAGNRSVEV